MCIRDRPETVRVWMMAVHGLWVADPGLPFSSGFLFGCCSFLLLFSLFPCCFLLLLFGCFVSASVPAVLCGFPLLLACCSPCLFSFSPCPGSVTCSSGKLVCPVCSVGTIAAWEYESRQPTNQPTYNALISACEKGTQPEQALKVFEAMV